MTVVPTPKVTTMKAIATTAAVVSLLLCSAAQAQHFRDITQQLDANDRMIAAPLERGSAVRVQVSYQMPFPFDRTGNPVSWDEQKAAIMRSHDALYQLASHECDQLKAAFPGDCRIVSLNVDTGQQSPFNGNSPPTVSATATFELAPVLPSKETLPKP